MKPTTAKISQPYGQFPQASGQPWIHLGDDYACYRGQDVVTIAPGRVLFAGRGQDVPNHLADKFMLYRGSDASGNCVLTEHDGWWQTFNHLEFVTVNTGNTLFRGQRVGGAGDSGNAQGVHLHHECINPLHVTQHAPFGRYNPALQIALEDKVAAQAAAKPKPKPPAPSKLPTRTITAPVAAVLTAPRSTAPLSRQYPHGLKRGAKIAVLGYVAGEDITGRGDNAWFKTVSGLYVWANAAGNSLAGLKML